MSWLGNDEIRVWADRPDGNVALMPFDHWLNGDTHTIDPGPDSTWPAYGWDKSEPFTAFPHSDVLQGLRIQPEQPTRPSGLIRHYRNRHNSASRPRHRSCPSKNLKETVPKRVRLLKLAIA